MATESFSPALKAFYQFTAAARSWQSRILSWGSIFAVPAFSMALAPPWPYRPLYAVLAVVIELPIYILCFAFLRKRDFKIAKMEQHLVRSIWTFVVGGIVYGILAAIFFYFLPDFFNMDIGGLLLTEETKRIAAIANISSTRDLIMNAGNDPEKVFEMWSLILVRLLVILVWTVGFAGWVYGFTVFVALQEKRQRNKRNAVDTPDAPSPSK